MEAILKSGKKIKGRLAEILVKRGRATPLEFVPEPEVIETEPVLEEVVEPITEPVLEEEKPAKKGKKEKASKVQNERKPKAKK